MTTQNIERLRRHFKDATSIIIDVIDENGNNTSETFHSFDEAKQGIEMLEHTNEVYF